MKIIRPNWDSNLPLLQLFLKILRGLGNNVQEQSDLGLHNSNKVTVDSSIAVYLWQLHFTCMFCLRCSFYFFFFVVVVVVVFGEARWPTDGPTSRLAFGPTLNVYVE